MKARKVVRFSGLLVAVLLVAVMVSAILYPPSVLLADMYEGQNEITVGSAGEYELWAPNSMSVECRPGDLFYINAVVKEAPPNAYSWIEVNGQRTSQDRTGRKGGKLINQTAWVADKSKFSVVHFVTHDNPRAKDFVGCHLVVVPVRRPIK